MFEMTVMVRSNESRSISYGHIEGHNERQAPSQEDRRTVWMEEIVLPSGFEPELKPREGFMIGRYTTGAGSHRIDM